MKVKTKYTATVQLNAHEIEQLMIFIGRLSLGLKLREFVDREFNDMSEVIDMLLRLRENIYLAAEQRA